MLFAAPRMRAQGGNVAEDTGSAANPGVNLGPPLAIPGEAHVHHGQARPLGQRDLDRLLAARREAGNLEAGFGERRFHLHGDEEVVLDHEDALGFLRPLVGAGCRIVAGEHEPWSVARRGEVPGQSASMNG